MFLACMPASGAPQTLKIAYALSRTSQLGAGANVFATEVAKRTEGRYRIADYPDAMLGDDVSLVRDLKLGAVDLGFLTGRSLVSLVPAAGVFDIPFLFRNAAQARAVLDGQIGDAYLLAFDGAGLVGLAWGENGMRHLTNSKHPVRSPEDLKDLKVRVPLSKTIVAGFQALGAEPKEIAFADAYSALESGRVDAQENSIASIQAANFARVQKYLTLTAHIYAPAAILMSQDAYGSLSDIDKQAFREAARLGGCASRAAAEEAERTGIAELKAQGMAVIETIDRPALSGKIDEVASTFDQQFGHDVIDRIRMYNPAAPTVSIRTVAVCSATP